jgi:thiosulfate/3-mercaptopyruvate sulfurtransferase
MRTVRILWLPLLLAMLVVPVMGAAADLPAIVTTEWLEQNLGDAQLVVVDIRKVEDYKDGHVPGAVNVFYGSWAIKRDGLDNELPLADDLVDILNANGITPTSRVVVVGKSDSMPELTNVTRVAWTLEYAGVESVAVLDGGHTKWLAEKRAVSTDRVKRTPVTSDFAFRKAVFATKADVLARRGQAVVVDTRAPEFFFGVAKLPFVDRAGRIEGAVSLPSPWIFKDGAYRPVDELRAIAASVLGTDPSKAIFVYCDTGRFATAWWWVLTQALGYTNVKMYDGSSQQYAKDAGAPMAQYGWR